MPEIHSFAASQGGINNTHVDTQVLIKRHRQLRAFSWARSPWKKLHVWRVDKIVTQNKTRKPNVNEDLFVRSDTHRGTLTESPRARSFAIFNTQIVCTERDWPSTPFLRQGWSKKRTPARESSTNSYSNGNMSIIVLALWLCSSDVECGVVAERAAVIIVFFSFRA